MAGILGIYASQNYPRVTNSYESIATVTIGAGGASSATFSSIPSTYKHLQIRGIFRPTTATWIIARFNGDSATNYSQHDLRGDGSTTSSEYTINATSAYFILGTGTGTSIYGTGVMDILEYANTNIYTTTKSLNGIDANGSGNVDLTSSSWRNSSVISSIALSLNNAGTIPEYSSFALYGIKG
jgi:hypothetical protein